MAFLVIQIPIIDYITQNHRKQAKFDNIKRYYVNLSNTNKKPPKAHFMALGGLLYCLLYYSTITGAGMCCLNRVNLCIL